jgi:hypothetical protein
LGEHKIWCYFWCFWLKGLQIATVELADGFPGGGCGWRREAVRRFFALNPDASAYRHDYALDAYLCGHYAEFLAQAKLFSWTNFQYFGGEDKFRQMLIRAAAAKPDAPLKEAPAEGRLRPSQKPGV